jgi:hypothetical protein
MSSSLGTGEDTAEPRRALGGGTLSHNTSLVHNDNLLDLFVLLVLDNVLSLGDLLNSDVDLSLLDDGGGVLMDNSVIDSDILRALDDRLNLLLIDSLLDLLSLLELLVGLGLDRPLVCRRKKLLG